MRDFNIGLIVILALDVLVWLLIVWAVIAIL